MTASRILLALTCLSLSLFANPLLWNEALNTQERWQGFDVSSGTLLFIQDPPERAIRFHATWKATCKNKYAAPLFKLWDFETLEGAQSLSFHIKFRHAQVPPLRGCWLMLGQTRKIPIVLKPTQDYQKVTLDLTGFSQDLKTCRDISLKFSTDASQLNWLIRDMCIQGKSSGVRIRQHIDTALAARATVPGAMFYDTEPLSFNMVIPHRANYMITTIWGTQVDLGTVEPGLHTFKPLPRGYYYLTLAAPGTAYLNRRSFAVIGARAPLPKDKETGAYSLVVATHMGRSDLRFNRKHKIYPGGCQTLLPKIARRAGIYTARDHIFWQEPAPGVYDWDDFKFLSKLFAEQGIYLTDMVSGTPRWMKNNLMPIPLQRRGGCRLPDDLFHVYSYEKNLAKAFRENSRYSEFWNEPDAQSNAAWNYAAAAKVASLALTAGNPDIKVTTGSFLTTAYADVAMQNGLADYIDIMNFHTYSSMPHYPETIAKLNKILADNGAKNRAIIITECGLREDGAPTQESYGYAQAQDPNQEMVCAEFFPKSQILMQSLGVFITYGFAAIPATGEDKDWGMIRQDFSAKPALVAFSTMSNALSPADYIGRYNPSSSVDGYLYQNPDGSQTLAFWRRSELDDSNGGDKIHYVPDPGITAYLPQQDGTYMLRDVFGTPSTVSAKHGKLPIKAVRHTSYIFGLHGLTPQVPPPASPRVERSNSGIDRTVVLNVLTSTGFTIPPLRLAAELSGTTGDLLIQLYNVSSTPKQGHLTFNGCSVKAPGSITLPPYGMKTIKVAVTMEQKAHLQNITVTGTFNGKSISQARIPVFLPQAPMRTVPLQGCQNIKNWRKSKYSTMTMHADAKEKSIAVETVSDYCYPEFILPETESLKGTIGLEFEMKVNPESAKLGYPDSRVMFDTCQPAGNALVLYDPPHDGEWQTIRVYTVFKVEDTAKVKIIRIGFNNKGKRTKFHIRNIKKLYSLHP